jgi:hypothetical protein
VAVILEVLHPGGTRTRHGLAQLPLTLGRSLSNDLVLDDPYVDASHARLVRDESGVLLLEDLGSINGLMADEGRLRGRIPVRPGAEVRLGRTMLRFRDPNEPVSPALLDDPSGRAAPAPAAFVAGVQPQPVRGVAAAARWTWTTAGRLTIVVLAMGVFSLYTWLGNVSRTSGSDLVSTMMGFALLVSLWAGIWAVASRVTVQRFHFVGHLAVASAVALAALGLTTLTDWSSFFFPDSGMAAVVSVVISFALLSALVAGHLSLASAMRRRRQWRVGLLVSGLLVAIGSLAALVDDDSFSDVPKFSSTLKPVAAAWVPTKPVADFDDVARELKKQVDRMVEK